MLLVGQEKVTDEGEQKLSGMSVSLQEDPPFHSIPQLLGGLSQSLHSTPVRPTFPSQGFPECPRSYWHWRFSISWTLQCAKKVPHFVTPGTVFGRTLCWLVRERDVRGEDTLWGRILGLNIFQVGRDFQLDLPARLVSL